MSATRTTGRYAAGVPELRSGAYEKSILIAGAWRGAGDTIPVVNPATGDRVASFAAGGGDDAREAVEAAWAALPDWSATSAAERGAILDRVAVLLRERAEEIGRLLALESGKLVGEAVGEINFSAAYFSWFAEEARRLESITVVDGRPSGPQLMARKAAGVAASLTPWNFPVSIQARKVAPALAAGCPVVARPSEEAPLSVVELFRCLAEAGVPHGVANLVTGPAREVTDPLVDDPVSA